MVHTYRMADPLALTALVFGAIQTVFTVLQGVGRSRQPRSARPSKKSVECGTINLLSPFYT